MLRAKVDDKETVNLIEGAAAGMVATVDTHGADAVQDWEVITFEVTYIQLKKCWCKSFIKCVKSMLCCFMANSHNYDSQL